MIKKSKEKFKGKEKKVEKTKKLSQQEFEKKVLDLAEKGLTAEKIGENLRREGIHPKEHGKKISKILIEKGKYINADLANLENKLNKIVSHYAKNKQDKRAMREKDRLFARFRKLKKYFKVQ